MFSDAFKTAARRNNQAWGNCQPWVGLAKSTKSPGVTSSGIGSQFDFDGKEDTVPFKNQIDFGSTVTTPFFLSLSVVIRGLNILEI